MIIILCVKHVSDVDCQFTIAIDQLSFFNFCLCFSFHIVYHLWWNKDVYNKSNRFSVRSELRKSAPRSSPSGTWIPRNPFVRQTVWVWFEMMRTSIRTSGRSAMIDSVFVVAWRLRTFNSDRVITARREACRIRQHVPTGERRRRRRRRRFGGSEQQQTCGAHILTSSITANAGNMSTCVCVWSASVYRRFLSSPGESPWPGRRRRDRRTREDTLNASSAPTNQ